MAEGWVERLRDPRRADGFAAAKTGSGPLYVLDTSDANEAIRAQNRSNALGLNLNVNPNAFQIGTTMADVSSSPLVYNIGLPRDAYFPDKFSSGKSDMQFTRSNQPRAVSSKDELWSSAGGHKGMLITYAKQIDNVTFQDSNFGGNVADRNNYAFQFHYNPSAVSMNYSGIPNTDPNYASSGNEAFNLFGANVTQSTISFQIFINRRFDMKYYDPNTKRLKAGVPSNLYAPRMPNSTEQQDIYNKGTMYDVEFLLSAIMGYKLKTALRGSTADIGYLNAAPVQLHLGNSLRYRGYVTGIDLQHAIFDERMVPLASTCTINFQRLPDYTGTV